MASSLYWIIVAIWLCVLVCAVRYGFTTRTVFGSARVLMLVVGIDTIRDIAENVYFGLYFGSQYGLFSSGFATVLGQPFVLILPKVLNAAAGLVVLFILFARWLPRASRERQALAVQATTDALTGLLNSREFSLAAQAEIDRCRRYRRPLNLLMLDIDNFKRVNDQHGHATGDLVIRQVAATTTRICRSADSCGRIGGEEFVVLLPESPGDSALTLAERLRGEVWATTVAAEQGPIRISVSIGVAQLDADIATVADLLKCADRALYEAKRSGRNRVCAYQARGAKMSGDHAAEVPTGFGHPVA